MTNLTAQAYLWHCLHDAARVLALAHHQPLARNPQGHLQPATLARLQPHCRLATPTTTPLTREVDAPHLSFLLHVLLRATWLLPAQSSHHLTCAATVGQQLQTPLPLLVQQLRQVWWQALLPDVYTLPPLALSPTYARRWRALSLATCAWVARLPNDSEVSIDALTRALQAAKYLTPPRKSRHLPTARRAFYQQAHRLARFVLHVCLRDLGLLAYSPVRQPSLRTTPPGQRWLRAALAHQQLWDHPPATTAIEHSLPITKGELTPPPAPPLTLHPDLHITLNVHASPYLTFAAYHFATPELPYPADLALPARYTLSRTSLAHGVAWGYTLPEVLFLIGHHSGGEVPPQAWTQLQHWQQEIQTVGIEAGYHLHFPPAILRALWARPPFRHRTQRVGRPDTVWVAHSEAAALFRYIRRLGYTLPVPEAPPVPLPTASLPLRPLVTALHTYQYCRERMPGLAALDLAALIRDLERALPDPDRAAVARLVAAQRAVIGRALNQDHDAAPPSLRTRLETAIATGTPVTLTYIDTHAQRTQRVVHPLRLEERWGQTYLVANCDLRGEERHFRLDRIVAMDED